MTRIRAWIRGVSQPSTPHGPAEYDEECVPGEDQPEGKGWQALILADSATAQQQEPHWWFALVNDLLHYFENPQHEFSAEQEARLTSRLHAALNDRAFPPDTAALIAERDAQMLLVKACEHIAEGDDGWERLRNECPSTAAVAGLRDKIKRLEDETADWYQSDKVLRDRVEALEAERVRLQDATLTLGNRNAALTEKLAELQRQYDCIIEDKQDAIAHRLEAERALAEKIEQAALICDKIAELREQGAGLINGPGSRLRQSARMIRELAAALVPEKDAPT